MLGALFYPKGTKEIPVKFESLFIPYIYKEIYLEGVYIEVLNTRKDMVIIDVGANIGVVTQYMRDYAKKLIAIEPSTEHFEALKKNKEFNKWDNVTVVKAAIADKDGEMTLNLNNVNRTCHSLQMNYGQGGEKVKTICFETLFKEHKLDVVDFIKFDVEGAEDMILLGDSFAKVVDKIKAIEVEFHFPTYTRIVEHMIKLGFQARRYDSSAIIILFTK